MANPKPTPIKNLIASLGGPSQVAAEIGRTHSAVCQWHRVPSDHVPALVAMARRLKLSLTAADIRPDIPWEKLRRS